MQRKNNPSPFILPKIHDRSINKSLNSTASSKLKIPPAYVPDEWVCNHNKKRAKSEETTIKPKNVTSVNKMPHIVNYGNEKWVCNHAKHIDRNPETNLITQWKYKRSKLAENINENNEKREASRQRRRLMSLKRRSISYDKQLLDHYRRTINEKYNSKYSHVFKNKKGEFKNDFYRGILPSPIKIINKHEPSYQISKKKKANGLYDSDRSSIMNSTPVNREIKNIKLERIGRKEVLKSMESDKLKMLNEELMHKRSNGESDNMPCLNSSNIKSKDDNNEILNELKDWNAEDEKFLIETIKYEESENELIALFNDKSNNYEDESFITDVSMDSLKSLNPIKKEIKKNQKKTAKISYITKCKQKKTKLEELKVASNSFKNSRHSKERNKNSEKKSEIDLEITKKHEIIPESNNESNEDSFASTKKESIRTTNNSQLKQKRIDKPTSSQKSLSLTIPVKAKKTKQKKSQSVIKKQIKQKSDNEESICLLPLDEHKDSLLTTVSLENKNSQNETVENKKNGRCEENKKNGIKRLISKSFSDYASFRKNTLKFEKMHTKSLDQISYNSLSPVKQMVENCANKNQDMTNAIIEMATLNMENNHTLIKETSLTEKTQINNGTEDDQKHIEDKNSSREGSSTSSQQRSVNIVKPFVIINDKNLSKHSNNSLNSVKNASLESINSSSKIIEKVGFC